MIPGFQNFMLPLLKYAADNEEHRLTDAVIALSDQFGFTPEERSQLLPSKVQDVVSNRIGWARSYLKKAGLLEYPRPGHFKITERGREVLSENLEMITTKYLKRFDEFAEVQGQDGETELEQDTPDDLLERGYAALSEGLRDDVLARIAENSPAFFERLVVDLLVRMGYGGSFSEAAAQVVGKSGDGGIDGIINEDKLGLEAIYVQAKRWKGGVGRPEIQQFVGALRGRKKGVFITTGTFTKEAVEFAEDLKDDPKVVLVDGRRLAELMIEHNVGVSTVRTIEIKQVDGDYFEV